MTASMKSIFLVNPISGRGHLDAYARLYSRALLELGYRVVLLAETDGDTTDYLARNRPDLESSFSFVSFDQARHWKGSAGASARAEMNLMRRSLLVWQSEGVFGLLLRCARVPHRFLLSLLPESSQHRVQRMERAIVRRLLDTRLAQFFDLAFRFDAGKISFEPLLEHVEAAVTMPGHTAPDLVFFLYLDLMAEQNRNASALDRPGAWPWIGILFHPQLANDLDARTEGYFNSKNARGGVFLVPSAIPAYAEATPNLHFALAPDVADLELPTEPPELAVELRKQAGDRTIVLQIGTITAHKDIPTLLDVIAAADPSRFFFALIGEVHWGTFTQHKSRIRSFYSRSPENVCLSQGYLKNERDYNGVIAASEIIYAVYVDLGSSSNSLTKAAGFHRPILVSENSLMGERVRRSNIGSVVPAGDAKGILERLIWLSKQPNDGFGFAAFADEQSLEALKLVLADALPSWLASAPSCIKSEQVDRQRYGRRFDVT
jgi:hypothetical protein